MLNKDRDRRSWQPREMLMLQEWLMKTRNQYRWRTRVRVGAPSKKLIRKGAPEWRRKMAGSWRRWADAIIFKPEEVVVVEATIVADPSKISQLELYLMLYNQTPELPHTTRKTLKDLYFTPSRTRPCYT